MIPGRLSTGHCYIFDTWKISRQVLLDHFTSFGFTCHAVDKFEGLYTLPPAALMAVAEADDDVEKAKSSMKNISAKFKIAVSRLRSPNEVRTEQGIDAIVSRHIKRDSLRNLVSQLLKSGNTFRPSSRQVL